MFAKRIDNKTKETQSRGNVENSMGIRQQTQFKDNRKSTIQMMTHRAQINSSIAEISKNETGMPGQLKSGVESLSGIDMSDVRVHYNSSKPAQFQASAYAQGNQIHLGPGQERHLPHEAWHVVQQKQGRVRPTKQLKGVTNVNDDPVLEKEADVMGAKAAQMKYSHLESGRKLVQRNTGYQTSIQKMDINIDNVNATSSTAEIDKNVTPVQWNQNLTSFELDHPKPGYIGSAIVYSGESNATSLADKYIEGSQDWSKEERKARLGVKFGVNHMASVDPRGNYDIEHDVARKSVASYVKVHGKASAYIFGLTWGYSFKKGGITGTKTMAEMRHAMLTGAIGGERVNWKKGSGTSIVPASNAEVVTKLDGLAKNKGIPYGMLRSWVTHNGQAVNHRLSANNANPIYYHSLDADAPNFLTLKEKRGGGWKKVLEAYDEVVGTKGPKKMIIGGYNLLAQPEEHQTAPKDYHRTVQSNVVDLAIRQAIHSVAPSMTYPTEPNFLIEVNTYHEAEQRKAATGSYLWGDKAAEGRELYDNLISGGEVRPDRDVEYDPLASVATGVKGGGARLKIETGKKYDSGSISGQPHFSRIGIGDVIHPIEQYIVQAQSMAGASRIASAYVAAYAANNVGVTPPKRAEVIPLFHPVEKMVLELITGEMIAPPVVPRITFNDTSLPIVLILRQIHARLDLLKKTKAFNDIVDE